jgi:hypothetical protein
MGTPCRGWRRNGVRTCKGYSAPRPQRGGSLDLPGGGALDRHLLHFIPREGIVNLFVRCYHAAYKSDDRTSLRPYAAIGVPVISRQIWNLWAISWRYSEAGNRWRLGRKCWAIGP